jgi:anti-sigma factor RsiW
VAAVTGHPKDRLALAAAGALEPGEAAELDAHVRKCAQCAAEQEAWSRLAGALRQLPAARAPRAVAARTLDAAEAQLAARSERAWNRMALGFVVAFAWTATVMAWLVLDLVSGELALRLARPVGSTAAWYAAYLLAGWVSAGAAAVLLGRRAREEGRIA